MQSLCLVMAPSTNSKLSWYYQNVSCLQPLLELVVNSHKETPVSWEKPVFRLHVRQCHSPCGQGLYLREAKCSRTHCFMVKDLSLIFSCTPSRRNQTGDGSWMFTLWSSSWSARLPNLEVSQHLFHSSCVPKTLTQMCGIVFCSSSSWTTLIATLT